MSGRGGPAALGARWWRRAAAVLAASAAVSVVACSGRDPDGAAERPTVVEVGRENIVVVEMRELQVGPAISGTLEAKHAATLRAEVAGPVLQTYVERGEAVRGGQPLARIDDTSLRESLLSAQSARRSAELTLDNAQRDLDRSTVLEKAGAIAERDLEASRRALAAARAALADADARLTAARQQVDKTRITAPFAGVVSDRPVSAGDVVQPGTALVTVIDPSAMRLEASVPAEQISAVRVGAPVRFAVNGYPDRTFVGRIDHINPAADPATRQVRVYVSVPNGGSALVAGLFAEGRVASESRTALLAPQTAVDQRGAVPVVMRITRGRAERVTVQLGIRDDATGQIEIRAGLSPGDTLLLGAAQGMTPGTPVRVVGEGAMSGR